MLLIGVGIIQWAKKLMGDHEMVEMRHPAKSSDEDRAAVMADINAGIEESTFGRRPLIRNSLFLSVGALALPSVVLLRDLGPLPHSQDETVWKKGMRVVNEENWGIDGILCYSKICTHVGCPISLWEQQTHHLLCPCHQSTFDLADNGKVIFGPAHRPLPQLPLGVDSEGYIIAMSDFPDIVAPSYPELARDQKRLDGES